MTSLRARNNNNVASSEGPPPAAAAADAMPPSTSSSSPSDIAVTSTNNDRDALNARLSARRQERRAARTNSSGTTTNSNLPNGSSSMGTTSRRQSQSLPSTNNGTTTTKSKTKTKTTTKPSTSASRRNRKHKTKKGFATTQTMIILGCLLILVWGFGAYYFATSIIQNNKNSITNKNKFKPPNDANANVNVNANEKNAFAFASSTSHHRKNLNENSLISQEKPDHNTFPKRNHLNRNTPWRIAPDSVVDMRDMGANLPFDNPNGGAWTQGWDVQPVPIGEKGKPDLKIFVLPHSHCDPGWIKTFDDYFQSQTKKILSSVIEALAMDDRRKFIWAEISYFEWWWKEQDTTTQHTVRKLLADKQFEFVTGGWVQPDEANTQLYAMEIQLQEGHDFIRETFGEEYIPKYGWSIDPFGYSPTMAYLLAKYGFEGMLIQRVHYAVKKELALHQNLEFVWRQIWDTSGEYDIFTHVMPFYSYDVPHTCGPDPSVCCQFDFARMTRVAHYGGCPWHKNPVPIDDHNVKERALLLLDQYRKKNNLYRSNVVLAPLGDDFRYQTRQEAEAQYDNYQKIFDYVNQNVDGVSIQFGTLSDYFDAAIKTIEVPILKGSFFTYSDREEDYWSGYFTSRVFDKALDRQLERVLYAASSMGATKIEMQQARRALSLFQHHDGVTGTAKDHVVRDYANRIHKSIRFVQDWMISTIKQQHADQNGLVKTPIEPCWQSDSPRGLSQNLCADAPVILYNPLESEQRCGSIVVPGRSLAAATLPCELPGLLPDSVDTKLEFDPTTGLLIGPIREEWMKWKVRKGGAYLFFPGQLSEYEGTYLSIEDGGYVVSTENWKRTLVHHYIPNEFGDIDALVLDFIYETDLQTSNEEWLVRFTGEINNEGVFHTDLNGYNFDTHYFRSDLPIQSQVFPMPTHASIEDGKTRMTVLSEHAQGTASLQEGSIDVWLDRRLAQDDNRGVFQGVMDNVPTRTRLRVVLEYNGYDHSKPEFQITDLSRRMWKELNHPLEMFGQPSKVVAGQVGMMELDDDALVDGGSAKKQVRKHEAVDQNLVLSNRANFVPFVYMVYKRVDYLKQAIDSLRNSDFPRDIVPIIISHDGKFDDVVEYVKSLSPEFKVIQVFHPYSCAEHPDTFPGDDPILNTNYRGDTYGNLREFKVTCCKHHFTWLMNKVFTGIPDVSEAESFLFMEEDYIVAPTVYSTILTGVRLLNSLDTTGNDFFGLTLDPTEGFAKSPEMDGPQHWRSKEFLTGPFTMSRTRFKTLQENAREYCNFDDYNWDWSIVHVMWKRLLPFKVLLPNIPQVAHIGIDDGLHAKNLSKKKKYHIEQALKEGLQEFYASEYQSNSGGRATRKRHEKGYGGWGHPADQQHCMKLFGQEPDKPWKAILGVQ